MRFAIPFFRNSTIIFNYRYTDTVIVVVYSIESACKERQIAIYRSFSISGVRFSLNIVNGENIGRIKDSPCPVNSVDPSAQLSFQELESSLQVMTGRYLPYPDDPCGPIPLHRMSP